MKLSSYNCMVRVWYKNWGWFCDITHLIFLGSKITADGDCSHEIKRHLLLGRKAMINLARILKSRAVTLPTKVCLAKALVFPVVMYGYESWTISKAENWRTDAFKLWCWRRLLRVPGTARRSNQPRIFIGRTDAKAEALLWSPDAKNWLAEKDYFWERLRAGGEGGDREWNDWMASLTQFTWVWANSRRQWRARKAGLLQSMGSQKARHDLVTEQHFFQVWQSQFSLK